MSAIYTLGMNMKKIEDFLNMYKFLFLYVVLISVLIFFAGNSLGLGVFLMIIICVGPVVLWVFLYFSYKAIYDHLIKVRKAINNDKKL